MATIRVPDGIECGECPFVAFINHNGDTRPACTLFDEPLNESEPWSTTLQKCSKCPINDEE